MARSTPKEMTHATAKRDSDAAFLSKVTENRLTRTAKAILSDLSGVLLSLSAPIRIVSRAQNIAEIKVRVEIKAQRVLTTPQASQSQ